MFLNKLQSLGLGVPKSVTINHGRTLTEFSYLCGQALSSYLKAAPPLPPHLTWRNRTCQSEPEEASENPSYPRGGESIEQVLGWGWSGEGGVLLGTFEILATLPGAGAEHHPSVAILLPVSSVAIETGTPDKLKQRELKESCCRQWLQS